MELPTIQRIDASLLQIENARPASRPAAADFGEALGDALKAVEKLQLEADARSTEVAMGGGNLHETTIALEQADIAMRVATRVRNKLVEAYQEVMRMSI